MPGTGFFFKRKIVAQSCLILCDLMDCNQSGSSVCGILQVRILEWVAISLLRGIFLTQGLSLGLVHCRLSPALEEDSLPTELPGKPLPILAIYFKIYSVLLKYWMLHVAYYKNLWIVSSSFLPVLSCNSHYYLFYQPRASFLHPVYKALCSFLSIKLSGSSVLPTSPSLSGFVNCSWGAEKR